MTAIDFLPWDDNFNTGLREVDVQHRRLVELLNALATHVAFRSEIPQLDAMFDELAGYAVYHFQTEETIWRQYLAGDEAEIAHRATHAGFIEEVSRLRANERSQPLNKIAEETLTFLARWLISHILEADRYMASAVLAVREGMSREQAKQHAAEQMRRGTRALADVFLSINATPTTTALHLMLELDELRQARDALAQANAKNQAFLRLASDGLHIVDGAGNLVEVSDSFCAMLGYSRDEMVGMNMTRWDSRYAGAWSPELLRQRLENPVRSIVDTQHRHRDGGFIDVEVSEIPIVLGGQAWLFNSARDIRERKRVERELADERQRLADQARFTSQLIDTLPNPVFYKDEKGRYLGCNRAFEAYLGIECEALVGQTVYDLAPKELADKYFAADQDLFARGGTQNYQADVVYADGSRHSVVFYKATFSKADGKLGGLVGVMLDVTERSRMELVLQRQAAFTEAVIDAVVDGLAVCTEIPTPPYVQFSVWNPAMVALTGYTLEEINARGWFQAMYPEPGLRERARQRMERVRDGDHLQGEEWMITRCDGEQRTLDIRTSVVSTPSGGTQVLAVMRDVSRRKAAEQALRRQRDLAQCYLDTVQSIMLALDTQGRITMINRAGRQLLGYDEHELLGRDWFTTCLPHPEGMKETFPYFQYILASTGENFSKAQNPVLCRDGRRRLIEWQNSQLTDDAGGVIGTLSSGVDITERHRVELELQHHREHLEALVGERTHQLSIAKETAERANRAKSEFLSSMSHELRTPLNAIIGFTQMLEYDSQLSDDQQDSVSEILTAGRHLLHLINEVLDLARIESGRIDLSPEAVDLAALIDECRHLIEPLAAPRGITLAVAVPVDGAVHADRVRLKQALLNLLSNAVKYNRAQGRVEVSVEQHGALQDRRWRIIVADSGIGIDPERMTEVFLPFTRLQSEHSSIEGTGIGLTITKRLVTLMGGDIHAESQPGVGSRFTIDLPAAILADPCASAGESALSAKVVSAERAHRVLCIDDNPSNLKLMAQILGRVEHLQLLTAHAPQLGIDLALAHRPALILLDINMPGMDGYQVLEVLKDDPLTRTTPVIAITANALVRDVERGKAAGFFDYITKPIDIPRFLSVVERALSFPTDQAQDTQTS